MFSRKKVFFLLLAILFFLLFLTNNSYASSYSFNIDTHFYNVDFGDNDVTDFVFLLNEDTCDYILVWANYPNCYLGLDKQNDNYRIIQFKDDFPGDTFQAFNCSLMTGTLNPNEYSYNITANPSSYSWPNIYDYYTVYSSTDLYDTDNNLVFPQGSLTLIGLITTPQLKLEIILETIAQVLETIVPIAILVFSTLLGIFLIRYLISRAI